MLSKVAYGAEEFNPITAKFIGETSVAETFKMKGFPEMSDLSEQIRQLIRPQDDVTTRPHYDDPTSENTLRNAIYSKHMTKQRSVEYQNDEDLASLTKENLDDDPKKQLSNQPDLR